MSEIGKTDENLMLEVRDGNLDALVPLYDKYSGRIYNFFLRLTNNNETAKDLTQSLFSRIIKYRSSFSNDHTFKAWIYRMARNLRIDHFRKYRKEFKVDDFQSLSDNATEALDDFEKQQQHNTLYEALDMLPEDEKEIIELSRFQDMRYDEMAEMLNCSEGAVRVKIHRAVKKLKEIYFQIA